MQGHRDQCEVSPREENKLTPVEYRLRRPSYGGFHGAGLFYPPEPSTLVAMRCIETPHFVRGLLAILKYPQENLSLCSLRLWRP